MQEERSLSRTSSKSMDIEEQYIGIEEYVLFYKRLENHGIAANDVKKLKEAGHKTVNSLKMTSLKHFGDVKGITEQKLLKIMEVGTSLSIK